MFWPGGVCDSAELTAPQGGDGGGSRGTETLNTNRIHGAVCPRQVQVDQAVGLGQEQVEVLEGEKEGAFIGGVDSGPQRSNSDANIFTATMAERGSHFNKCKTPIIPPRRGYTDRGVISGQNSGILAQVQVEERIGVVVA